MQVTKERGGASRKGEDGEEGRREEHIHEEGRKEKKEDEAKQKIKTLD